MFTNRPSGAIGSTRYQELYPQRHAPGVDSTTATSVATASGGARLQNGVGANPTTVLIVIALILVAVRVIYEMTPEGGKGL